LIEQYSPGGAGASSAAGAGAGGDAAGIQSARQMREDLTLRWNELKTPAADRVDGLSLLLDAAQASPEMLSRYESIAEKLAARQPITQLANRKQFIEYKLKLATRVGPDGTSSVTVGITPADRAALIAELTEVQNNTDALIRQYERRFGESYSKIAGGNDSGGGAPASMGYSQMSTPAASAFSPSPLAAATAAGGAVGITPIRGSFKAPNSNLTSTPTAR
jgi:hypothetical protein